MLTFSRFVDASPCRVRFVIESDRRIICYTGEIAFVLAFEVLDNLPHDKVIFGLDGKPWEAVITDRQTHLSIGTKKTRQVYEFILSFAYGERRTLKSDTLMEVFRPAADSRILKMIDLMTDLEANQVARAQKHKRSSWLRRLFGYGNLRYSKTGVLTTASAVWHRQGIVYIPTGQLQFLKSIQRCFPRHCLLLSDFDSLPGMVLPGAGGPAVQSIGAVNNRICDRSSYLLPEGVSADIFFPTDFIALKSLYETLFGVPARVQSAAEFFAPFWQSINKCTTMSGYCPLTEYYKNTSYLTSQIEFNND